MRQIHEYYNLKIKWYNTCGLRGNTNVYVCMYVARVSLIKDSISRSKCYWCFYVDEIGTCYCAYAVGSITHVLVSLWNVKVTYLLIDMTVIKRPMFNKLEFNVLDVEASIHLMRHHSKYAARFIKPAWNERKQMLCN